MGRVDLEERFIEIVDEAIETLNPQELSKFIRIMLIIIEDMEF